MEPSYTHGITVTIDEPLINAFVAHSGDRSSLHTDAAFGQRSMYNSTVVHGMLPLQFLPAVLSTIFPGKQVRITRIEGQFIKPIFPNETVRIAGTKEVDLAGNEKILFSVTNAASDAVLTRGSLQFALEEQQIATRAADHAAPLVAPTLTEQEHYPEAIDTGHRSELGFVWGAEQIRSHLELLRIGSEAGSLDGTDPAPFAMLSLLSTLVGMIMPGRTATFQEFALDISTGTMGSTSQGTLRSTVTFRSATTNTIKQEFAFHIGSDVVATGTIAVLVAKSPFEPPSMKELAKEHGDPGLRNKVVLITGASRGLGATTAKMFAIHGARVVLNYRASQQEAEDIVAEIVEHGGQAIAIRADVTSEEQVHAMVKTAISAFGTIDILVNNAASNFFAIPFLETTWNKVQEDLDVIVKGAFHVSQAVIPEFIKHGGGRIINVSTFAVETPPSLQTKYVLAKSALNGLTRSLAVEFADRNILVNMVVPSMVETDFTRGFNQVALGKVKAQSPMKRLARPAEVADAIVFLASSRAGFTTGQKVMVTGGSPPYL